MLCPASFLFGLTLSLALALPAPAAPLRDAPAGLSSRGEAPETLAQKRQRKSRRQKAEEEAKQKAEEEEKQKAEEEAKQKAEDEARRKLAEEEHKREEAPRALEEAEQRAEEAKTKALEEAKQRAEEAKTRALEASGLDARMRRLSDALALAIKRLPGDHRDFTFAVLPFEESGEDTQSRRLGLVVSDMVMTNLARDHGIALTERAQLKRLVEEQELAALGFTSGEGAPEVGKLLGARAIIVGQVADTGDAFRVQARLLDAETGAVLLAEDTPLPKEELIAVSADAVVLRSKSGALFRSLVAPGWGQLYNREPVKAGIVGGTVGVLGLATLGTLTSAAVHSLYIYPQVGRTIFPNGNKDDLAGVSQMAKDVRESANAQFTAAAILAGVTAGAWLLGALEAYLSGTDVESLDEAIVR